MRAGSAFLPVSELFALAGLQQGHRVLDVGPGRTGHVLFPAAAHVGAQGRVFGLDIAKDTLDMLEGMRRQYLVHHIDFLWLDIEEDGDVPIQDIDVVFVVNTAWMFRQHAQVFARLLRSLREGGKIVVADWLPHQAHVLAPRWDFRIDPQRLDIVLAHSGLRATARAQITPWHWARVYEVF